VPLARRGGRGRMLTLSEKESRQRDSRGVYFLGRNHYSVRQACHPERSGSGVEGPRGIALKVIHRDSSTAFHFAQNDNRVVL